MKNKKDMNIKEKVKWVVSTMEITHYQEKYSYFEDMMYGIFKNDDDLPIIKSKMDNLVKLLESKNEEEFEKFMDLDFEEEIWDMI
jgi:helix-turn-helix protein